MRRWTLPKPVFCIFVVSMVNVYADVKCNHPEGIRLRFQIEACSWLPQTAAAWPQSLVWSIRGDVCPKLGWLVSSTATQRKTMSWRWWIFLIQWTDVLICLIMSYEQIIKTAEPRPRQRNWRTDLMKRSIRAQQLVEDSERDTEHGGQS